MKRGEKIIIGCFVFLGILTMGITSLCFNGVTGIVEKDAGAGFDYTVRDMIILAGQDAGELFWMVGFWILFRDFGLFLAVVEFIIAMLIVDLVMILFFNPYQNSWPKNTGIFVSLAYVLVMTKRYLK